MKQEPTQMSKREQFIELLQEKYPNREFRTDDDIFSAAIAYDLQVTQELEQLWGNDYKMTSLIAREPQLDPLLQEVAKESIRGDGGGVARAVASTFGDAIGIDPSDGEVLRKIGLRGEETLGALSQRRETALLQEQNWQETLRVVDQFAREKSLTDPEVGELLTALYNVAESIYLSKIDYNLLSIFHKAMHYDSDMSEAENRGRLTGRNENIALRKRNHAAGDSLPTVTSRRTTFAQPRRDATPQTNLEIGGYQPARHFR